MGFDFLVLQIGRHQAHSAVDIETDSTRRDDSGLGIHCGHPADGKTVAPMTIGHTEGISQDSGQGGDIGHLIKDAVIHLRQQFRGSDNSGGNPHSLFIRYGKFPDGIGNLDYFGRHSHISPPRQNRQGRKLRGWCFFSSC
jgi:hypothetical protein